MESLLKQFYIDMNNWIEAAYEGNPVFRSHTGLCYNLVRWGVDKNLNCSDLQEALVDQFMDAGLDPNYPFNKNDTEYDDERKGLMYQNPARLAWIKEHAQ